MSEEFTEEEFIIEEEETGANRAFLIAAGALVGLFILALLCILGFALLQRNQQADERATIIAANMTTEAENARVTQTIQAIETEAARPTDTPTQTPTTMPTPTATRTIAPTDTPVVQPPEGEGTVTGTPNLTATSIFGGGTPGATPTPIPSGTGTGDDGTLPQTGVGGIGAVVAALGFLALLVLARRLRTG